MDVLITADELSSVEVLGERPTSLVRLEGANGEGMDPESLYSAFLGYTGYRFRIGQYDKLLAIHASCGAGDLYDESPAFPTDPGDVLAAHLTMYATSTVRGCMTGAMGRLPMVSEGCLVRCLLRAVGEYYGDALLDCEPIPRSGGLCDRQLEDLMTCGSGVGEADAFFQALGAWAANQTLKRRELSLINRILCETYPGLHSFLKEYTWEGLGGRIGGYEWIERGMAKQSTSPVDTINLAYTCLSPQYRSPALAGAVRQGARSFADLSDMICAKIVG